MISKTRSFRDPRNPIGVLILLAAFAAAGGCSTSNTAGGVVVNHVDASGNSVPGWVTPTGGSHANSATMNYIANGGSSSCTECHGSDLAGGISGVSCFGNPAGCHHGPIAGWVAVPPAAQNHGVSAKKAPGSSGFASCQICHGNNFAGTAGGPTCLNNAACHGAGVVSPHARKPWRASAGSLSDHVTTDNANASVCYDCHAYTGTANPNNPHVPPTPAPAGTAPGCFNGTMCHNQGGHPAGWAATSPAPQPHGDAAKKDGTVAGQGFPSCQTCHGANFAGGSVSVSCFTCHGVNAPHAPKPWRGSPYTHTTTVEAGNAPVCYTCHAYTGTPNPRNPHVPPTPAPAGTAPGCFNGTMCHNEAGHPAGWVASSPAAQPHGDAAKKDNTVSGQGFASCQTCHGANFAGGSVSVSCFTCHGVNAPHAPKPWRGSPYTHTTTVEAGNAPVCYTCHAYTGTPNPRNPHVPPTPAPAGTAPGCFNGTMCHNEAGHPAGWVASSPAAQPHGDAAKKDNTVSGQGFASCQTCHGANFAGGSANVSCFLCHGSPHAPAPWRGAPYTHTDTDPSNAPVCAQCHRSASAPAGTAPGCFNNTLCHASPVPHPVDNAWVTTAPAAQPHGNSAKAAPGGTTGFSYCQGCHGTGTNFAGGTSLVSCYPCHGNVGTPHPSNWVGGGTYTHRTTNSGNATVCAFCHLNGANSPIAPPSPPAPAGTAVGCLNNTLCHN